MQARIKKGAAAEHAEDEDEAIFGEDQAAVAAEMQSRIKLVDPSVNIAADQFDTFQSGYGTSHSARQVGLALPVSRSFELHASILDSLASLS